jgi:hypothetical protein
MDGSAAAGGGAAALIMVLGFVFRTGVRMDRQARMNQLRNQRPTAAAPPVPAPIRAPRAPRDPMLLTAAMRESQHPDFDVRHAASAYLAGQLTDAEYAILRTRLPALYTPPPAPIEDEVPPEYRRGGRQ